MSLDKGGQVSSTVKFNQLVLWLESISPHLKSSQGDLTAFLQGSREQGVRKLTMLNIYPIDVRVAEIYQGSAPGPETHNGQCIQQNEANGP